MLQSIQTTELETTRSEAAAETQTATLAPESATLTESEMLVEQVSIDGMCGVY